MKRENITVSALVAAHKQKVWDYYTQPAHITQWNFADDSWHCPVARNDLTIGGRYFARMEARDGSAGFDFEAVYTEVDPGKAFTYEFGGRRARVEFNEAADGTMVSVTFEPEGVHAPERQRKGWQAILDNFKKYVEAHI